MSMIDFLFLTLLLFLVQFGIAGGWYEFLVMYPRWGKDVSPTNLRSRLEETGQLLANRRYWSLLSLAVTLVSAVNVILAWQSSSEARTSWLCASAIVFLNRIITFGYFAPTMVRKFEYPENIDTGALKRSVRTWTLLSPMRALIELIAWALGVWALFLLR